MVAEEPRKFLELGRDTEVLLETKNTVKIKSSLTNLVSLLREAWKELFPGLGLRWYT